MRAEIVAIGLNHHLVTKHTSLVAVEQTASRSVDDGLNTLAIPTNLPKDWLMEDIWQIQEQRSKEFDVLREEMKKSREAGPILAMATSRTKQHLEQSERVEKSRSQEQGNQVSTPVSVATPSSGSSDASFAQTDGMTSSSAKTRVATSQGSVALPQTATGATLWLLIGIVLFGLALAVATGSRRWRVA